MTPRPAGRGVAEQFEEDPALKVVSQDQALRVVIPSRAQLLQDRVGAAVRDAGAAQLHELGGGGAGERRVVVEVNRADAGGGHRHGFAGGTEGFLGPIKLFRLFGGRPADHVIHFRGRVIQTADCYLVEASDGTGCGLSCPPRDLDGTGLRGEDALGMNAPVVRRTQVAGAGGRVGFGSPVCFWLVQQPPALVRRRRGDDRSEVERRRATERGRADGGAAQDQRHGAVDFHSGQIQLHAVLRIVLTRRERGIGPGPHHGTVGDLAPKLNGCRGQTVQQHFVRRHIAGALGTEVHAATVVRGVEVRGQILQHLRVAGRGQPEQGEPADGARRKTERPFHRVRESESTA